MANHQLYKGFLLALMEETQQYRITLENVFVADAKSIDLGMNLIDFYHQASEVTFKINRERASKKLADLRENAPPEPPLTDGIPSRPSVNWVKWFRALSGCSLREAVDEGAARISAKANQKG